MDTDIHYILYEILKQTGMKTVLDIGCGRAMMLFKLAQDHSNVQFWGIDKNQDQMNLAKWTRNEVPDIWNNTSLDCMDFKDLDPHKYSETFDIIYIHSAIQYFDHFKYLIKLLRRLIKPDGFLLISHIPRNRAKKMDPVQRMHNIDQNWFIEQFTNMGWTEIDTLDQNDRFSVLFTLQRSKIHPYISMMEFVQI